MNPYEVVSRQISSQLNIKQAELNNSTMVEIGGKIYVLQKESDDDWLQFSLLIVDLSAQGQVRKVPIVFHKLLANEGGRQQGRTTQVKVRANAENAANDLKIDFVSNPKNPNNWFLLLRNKLQRRLFVHQFITAEKQIIFFEYTLRSRAVKSVKWCPLSPMHLMVLYKSELEIVNLQDDLFVPETYVDIGQLYSESYEGDIPQLADIAMLNNINHMFQAYVVATNGIIMQISPIILNKFKVAQYDFFKMLENLSRMDSLQNFIKHLMNHQKTVVKKNQLSGDLVFSVDVKLAKQYEQLTVVKVLNRKQKQKWSSLYMLEGVAFPILLASHTYQGETAGRVSCFLVNGGEALEAYQMELDIMVSTKMAVETLNSTPKVIYQEGIQNVLVLFLNRIFKIDLTPLDNVLRSNKAIISKNKPRVSVWLEPQIHKNKEVDKFDLGYYGIHIDQNKVCSIRLYDNEVAAFQLSPILKISNFSVKDSLETILKTMKSPMETIEVKQEQPSSNINSLRQEKNKDQLKFRMKDILYQSQLVIDQNMQSFDKMISQLGQYNKECKQYRQNVNEIKELMNKIVKNKDRIKDCQKKIKLTGWSMLTQLKSDFDSYESILNNMINPQRNYEAENRLKAMVSSLKKMKEKLIQLKISKAK